MFYNFEFFVIILIIEQGKISEKVIKTKNLGF